MKPAICSGGALVQVTETQDTLVSRTVRSVTGLIRAGKLGPGDRLPSETELSRDLGVSRNVVREAYRSLATLHLIELGNGRRARVAHLDHHAMSLMIGHGVQTEQISIQQVYDVRRTIEMRTVALAALRRSESEADALVGHARAMADNFDDPPKVMAHDVAFHETIATACRNPVFALITGALTGVMRETWAVGWQARPNDAERWLNVNCHNAIADAVKAGDPKTASEGIAEHYDHSTKALVAAGIG